MKTSNLILVFAALTLGFNANAQTDMTTDNTQSNPQLASTAEVPGDNFSLEGALELFKKSSSPEDFERSLNSSDSKVNNLDLNNDNNIDYIKVIDRNEGNIHAFILQAVISATENQDVAVIELQKLDDGKATLQITGDADVYGVETIIEPSDEVRVNAGTSTERVVTNVWNWPAVQYVYTPYYNPWMSPWAWSSYPIWWRTWSPVPFYTYSPWWTPFRPYYSFCYSHRIGYMPRFYAPYRCSSRYVYNNYHSQINNYRSNYHATNNGSRGRNGNNNFHGYAGRTTSDFNHGYRNNGSHYGSNAGGRGRIGIDNGYRSYQGYQGFSGRHASSRSGFSHGSSSAMGGIRNNSNGFTHSGSHSGGFSGGSRSHFSGGHSGGFHSGGGHSGGSHSGGGHGRGR